MMSPEERAEMTALRQSVREYAEEILRHRVAEAIKADGTSVRRLEIELGMAAGSLNGWRCGKRWLGLLPLLQLADRLGIAESMFVGVYHEAVSKHLEQGPKAPYRERFTEKHTTAE